MLLTRGRRRAAGGFFSGFAIGSLGGMIGLGGAEFRLPLLVGFFRLKTLEAIILNKATSLVVVSTALFARSVSIPDIIVWGVVALIVQLGTFFVARLVFHDLVARIERGEMASAALARLLRCSTREAKPWRCSRRQSPISTSWSSSARL